ncbi:HD domain-containing protein [Fodinicola acaciae]|uniref:HD domain-containing protein n=1 Tax=Fodinicola acaciae TaxID=2681555 RepID=UPI001C9E6602|nr:metal-dependent phosphohydrolase [Fodinicola acaciae]
MHDDLLIRWPLQERFGAGLVERWREPHRRYHTVEHLTAMLDVIDAYAHAANDPDAVRLAAWFHDAIYAPKRTDNEEASAALAGRMLSSAGLPPARVAEVRRLVLLTRTHDPAPKDTNGALLCDADLAVLAGSAEAYAAYVFAVRQEYAHVSDPAFAAGRAEVLREILALPRIFRLLPESYENAARANVHAELSSY